MSGRVYQSVAGILKLTTVGKVGISCLFFVIDCTSYSRLLLFVAPLVGRLGSIWIQIKCISRIAGSTIEWCMYVCDVRSKPALINMGSRRHPVYSSWICVRIGIR